MKRKKQRWHDAFRFHSEDMPFDLSADPRMPALEVDSATPQTKGGSDNPTGGGNNPTGGGNNPTGGRLPNDRMPVSPPSFIILVEKVEGGFVASVKDDFGAVICHVSSTSVHSATLRALNTTLSIVDDTFIFKVVPLTEEVETYFDDEYRKDFTDLDDLETL